MALLRVNPGFSDPAHVQTMRTAIPSSMVPDEQMVARIQNNLVDRLAAIPDVAAVGFAASVPLDGIDADWNQFQVEGKDYDVTKPQMRLYDYVSPGYFNAMGIHLVAGRDFNWTDNYSLRHKVIVSESFARETWGSAANAIGKHAHQSNRNPWDEVIGVVEDVHQHGVDEKAPIIIYWPVLMYIPYIDQPTIGAQRNVTFAIHSRRAGSESFLSQVRQAVSSVNPPSWPTVVARANAMLECWYLGQEGGTRWRMRCSATSIRAASCPSRWSRDVGQVPFYLQSQAIGARAAICSTPTRRCSRSATASATPRFDISPPRLSAARSASAGIGHGRGRRRQHRRPRRRRGRAALRPRPGVSVARPVKELKGFERVTLAARREQDRRLTLGPDAFRMWNGTCASGRARPLRHHGRARTAATCRPPSLDIA